MPSPFPGMDPYLEDPQLWSGFHASFIAEIQTQLSTLVRPNFFVRIEERVYLAGEENPTLRMIVPYARVTAVGPVSRQPPRSNGGGLMIAEPIPVVEALEDQVHETRIEIRDRNDRTIVTVIEVLSPSNKLAGSLGRESFLQKRREILSSTANWIEIDLLREGRRSFSQNPRQTTPYMVYLSRAGDTRRDFIWPIALREPLPVIGVPLRGGHPDVALDLQAALNQVYTRGGYDLDIDYQQEPRPPLTANDANWSRDLLQDKSKSD